MKEIVTWSLSSRVNGGNRRSPEYSTPEEACANIVPFLKKLQYHYTNVVIVRSVRYEAVEGAAQ